MSKPAGARENLLSAATELFRARGYEGVGVAELLEASGAPRGSLYFHFPGGKEQIGIEVIERVGGAVAGQFRGLNARDVDLDAYVDAIFKTTARQVKERDFDASCPVAAIAAEASNKNPALLAAVSKVMSDWEREIAAGAEARGLSAKSAAEFASALVTSMEGAFLVSKSQRSVAPHLNAARAVKALGAALRTQH